MLDDLMSELKLRDSSIASMVNVSVSRLSIEPEHDGELSGFVFKLSCIVSNWGIWGLTWNLKHL